MFRYITAGYVAPADFDKVTSECKELKRKYEDAVSEAKTLREAAKERDDQLQIQIDAKLKLSEDLAHAQSELKGLVSDYQKLTDDIEVVEKDLIGDHFPLTPLHYFSSNCTEPCVLFYTSPLGFS